MDLGTIIGFLIGLGTVLFGIIQIGADLGRFFHIPSIFITLGGSLGALLATNPLSRTLGIMKYFLIAIRTVNYEEEKIISTLVTFSERARREGLLALEDDLEEVEDQFMKKGIQLVVDGTDPEIIKNLLYNELNQLQERHQKGIQLFTQWGMYAPAFGMIGTLIGLIAMLNNLSDADAIGPGMAAALMTTFYGALFANLFFIPLAKKLEDKDRAETLVREIMIEGILSIQSGDNPRILETKLISFLPPSRREAVLAESGGE